MKKTIANIVFVIFISGIMIVAGGVIHMGIALHFLEERTFNSLWAWYSWLAIVEWTPRIFIGFLAGVCVALLVYGEKQKIWALSSGIAMTVISFSMAKSYWVNEPSWLVKLFYNVWPLMYVAGAYLGYLLVSKVKYVLVKHRLN